jgi:Rrf2 family protein
MMRVSTRARYALRMMLDVARHGGESAPVSLSSVSKRTAISKGYLEQVALSLRSARLLRGVFGRHGGYRLTAPTDEITVGRIFEALIGPTCLVDCVDDPASCPRSDYCECRVVYRLMNERVLEVLQSTTLANLLDPEWVRAHGSSPIPLEGVGPEGFGCNPTAGDERTGADGEVKC